VTDRRLRRNDVVIERENSWLYGRVVRCIDSETVVVIDCGKHHRIFLMEDLKLTDYRGYHRRDRFVAMPSLRRLKQNAAGYHPEVWRHYRRRHGLEE
jgi:hypothetical protein